MPTPPTQHPTVQEAREAVVRLGEYLGAAYAEAVTHQRPATVARLLAEAMRRSVEVQALLAGLAAECAIDEWSHDEPDAGLGL